MGNGATFGDKSPGTIRADSVKPDATGMLKVAYTLDDEVLKYIASYGKQGNEKPTFTSKLFETSGRLVMRSDWGKDALFAFMNFDAGGGHGHNDDNTLNISAYGNNLLVDQSGGAYDGTLRCIL